MADIAIDCVYSPGGALDSTGAAANAPPGPSPIAAPRPDEVFPHSGHTPLSLPVRLYPQAPQLPTRRRLRLNHGPTTSGAASAMTRSTEDASALQNGTPTRSIRIHCASTFGTMDAGDFLFMLLGSMSGGSRSTSSVTADCQLNPPPSPLDLRFDFQSFRNGLFYNELG